METEKTNENLADIRHYKEKYLPQIEKALREYSPVSPPKIEKDFNEVIEFVLFNGEERIGSILTLLGAELFGGKAEDFLPAATAVEFIDKSSKIFNELNFAINAANIEGSETVVEKFGQGLTSLVALNLLNSSYSMVFVNHIGMPERAFQAHAEIVECVGASGIFGGQLVELKLAKSANVGKIVNEIPRDNFNNPALIRLSLRIGAILAGADYLDLAHLSRFAEVFGDAFQISKNSENSADISARNQLNELKAEGKRLLVENFQSNEARSCLIQLTEYLTEK